MRTETGSGIALDAIAYCDCQKNAQEAQRIVKVRLLQYLLSPAYLLFEKQWRCGQIVPSWHISVCPLRTIYYF